MTHDERTRALDHHRIDQAAWQTPWHRRLAKLGGTLLRLGFSPLAVRAALEVENGEGGVMKSDESDVHTLCRWLNDLEPGDRPAPWVTNPIEFVFAWKACGELNAPATNVLLAIAGRSNVSGEFPVSMARLAKDASMTPSAVAKGVNALERAGAIERIICRSFRGERGPHGTNRYLLKLPRCRARRPYSRPRLPCDRLRKVAL
jgi:hypothetical protein